MAEDESIAGAVFRSTSRHVMPTVFPVLSQARVDRQSIGFMQILPEDAIKAIADIIRCEPERLTRDAGVRLGNSAPDERGRQRIGFGDLVIESSHLEHRRRRVSPRSLVSSPHHRTDWLNRILPYCPASFDLLIDTCPSCKMPLGWTRPEGVQFCEHCQYDLREAVTIDLDEDLAADYRSFADLCSPNAERRKSITRQLPHPLCEIPPGTLIRFVLQIGQVVLNLQRIPETHLPDLEPMKLARIVAAGMGIAKGWPSNLQQWALQEGQARVNDRNSYLSLRSDLRKLARKILLEPDGSKIAHDSSRSDSYGATGFNGIHMGHYSQREARSRLDCYHNKLTEICDLDLVPNWKFRYRSGAAGGLFLIDSERIDQLAGELASSVPSWQVRRDLCLPPYAIDQLICLGVVMGNDPAVRFMKGKQCLPKTEVDQLVFRIKEMAIPKKPPKNAISLRSLANCIGGKEKPWGAIIKAIIEGEISFWLKNQKVTTHQILLDPREKQKLLDFNFDRRNYPHYKFRQQLDTFDVQDLLNIQPSEGLLLRRAKVFDTRKRKRSFDYDLDDVLALSQEWVSVTELIRRFDMNDRVVKRRLAAAGVASKLSLWERRQAEAECMRWKMGQ